MESIGLTSEQVAASRTRHGPNIIYTHRTRWWSVLAGQLRSPLLRTALLTVDPDDAAVSGHELDRACTVAAGAAGVTASGHRRLGGIPFDHDRRVVSAHIATADGQGLLVVKGAAEAVLARCDHVPDGLRDAVAAHHTAGDRVLLVATRPLGASRTVALDDETGLRAVGLLTFRDVPKASAAQALTRLSSLGVRVVVATGDHPGVAQRVCAELGLPTTVATGAQLAATAPADLPALLAATSIFAQVSPDQKAQLVAAYQHGGHDVAFLGDGVNDAPALHLADVGVSVDTAADVARDAADVVLLRKDLGVLGEGIMEGRRIFANTFGLLFLVLHASASTFQTGWLRTRRVPAWHSTPGPILSATVLGCLLIGIWVPFSPLAGLLGFTALPAAYLALLATLITCYLVLAEAAKWWFYRTSRPTTPSAEQRPSPQLRQVHRRALRIATRHPKAGPSPPDGGPMSTHQTADTRAT